MKLCASEQSERVSWSVKTWNRINFVTATLREETQDHSVISRKWYAWMKILKRRYPGIRVIRVLQKHPGGHGWHVHALVDRYLPAKVAWATAAQAGLGRIDMQMVSGHERHNTISYLVRYLTRDAKKLRGSGIRMMTATGNLRCKESWWVRVVDCFVKSTISVYRRSLVVVLSGGGIVVSEMASFMTLLRGSPPWAIEQMAQLHPGCVS